MHDPVGAEQLRELHTQRVWCLPSLTSSHPIQGLPGGGKWKGSLCGKAGVPLSALPHSALLEGQAPSAGAALREGGDSWGWFFWMFVWFC